ncbi:MAG: hypothetical protein ACP5OG_00950 [Candidatus Nanoarchaeia archaeon]
MNHKRPKRVLLGREAYKETRSPVKKDSYQNILNYNEHKCNFCRLINTIDFDSLKVLYENKLEEAVTKTSLLELIGEPGEVLEDTLGLDGQVTSDVMDYLEFKGKPGLDPLEQSGIHLTRDPGFGYE